MPPIEPSGGDPRNAGAAGAILTIDLGALAANYRLLRARAAPAVCAAVVKANAYGIGVDKAAPALARAGCRDFFVATLEEGVALRAILPDARIFVLNGLAAGAADMFAGRRLIPVLNDLDQIAAWKSRAASGPAAIHLDSGMNRLGLGPAEAKLLAGEPGRLDGIEIACLISHLACSEDGGSGMNRRQLDWFQGMRAKIRPAPASLANSSGIFLGPEYHLDLVRAGVALYGANPRPGEPNPMAQVVHLEGKIIQVRQVDRGMTVGYGASHGIAAPGRLATVAVGYADGYSRAFSNRGFASIGGHRVPVVGRVSMDLLTVDVSEIPPDLAKPGCLIDLIGGGIDLDDAAAAAETISYELLTGLGARCHRIYIDGGA